MAKPIELTPPLPHADYTALVERLKRDEKKPLSPRVQNLLAKIRQQPLIQPSR